MAARSRQAYGHQVGRHLAWLGDRSPVDGDPLSDGEARDWAVRDYKRHLKAVEGGAAMTAAHDPARRRTGR